MSTKRVKYIKSVLLKYRMKKIVKRFCKDLDFDYLLSLSESYKKTILNECKKNQDWLSTFFTCFLSYKYD